jgi:O-antigen/teichoic acid export membrane protein
MLKRLITYAAGEAGVKSVGFLLLPLYSHLILPEEYGILGFLNAFVAFLPFIFTFYYLYGYIRFSLEEDDQTYISTFLMMGMGLNLFFILMSIAVYFLLSQYYFVEWYYFMLCVMALAALFVFQIMQMYHRSKNQATEYVKYSTLYVLFGSVCNVVLLIMLVDNVLAMLVSSLVVNMFASIMAYRKLRAHWRLDLVSLELIKRVLRYTVMLVPGAVSLLLFSQMDKIMLAGVVSNTTLGVYTMAFVLGLSMSYLGSALFMSVQPTFYELAKANRQDELEKNFRIYLLLLGGAVLLVMGVIKIAYFLIDLRYSGGEQIAMLVALAYSLMSAAQFFELHLTYIRRTSLVSLIYGIGGVLNIVLLYIMIRSDGIYGAAIALLLSAAIIVCSMYLMAQRHYRINYRSSDLMGFGLLIMLLTGVTLW